ncbi:thioredoxin [[Clostridium] dakarense]|uniref:thioredoxin n=1 Tax=Faecalimicrobium dakarense TaxID=1301100 RepID=UPI002E8E19D8|nr:thioredoxin [[Clostridium] dakarense]
MIKSQNIILKNCNILISDGDNSSNEVNGGSAMVKILNTNDFNKEIENKEVSIVDFFATWCGPCKMLAPVFEDLSNEMDGSVGFYKVDIDQSLELAQRYGINTVPTMLISKNEEVVDQIIGFVPKENIKAKINQQL